MSPKSELERQLEETLKMVQEGKFPKQSLSERLRQMEGDDLPDALEGPDPEEEEESVD